MKKRLLITAGFVIAVGFGMTGCQSQSWGIKNPFERKPEPNIKSPADMDDIQLKAPPERYTKDDYIHKMEKEAESGNSLAQQGSYGDADSEKTQNKSADRVAMADGGNSPKQNKSVELTDSEPAPGFGDYDTPSGLDESVPFAPGSINSGGTRY